MRTIEPLGNEEEILREVANNTPQKVNEGQTASVTVSDDNLLPSASLAPAPLPNFKLLSSQRRRNSWLLILAVATIFANCFLVSQLLTIPSDTSMLLAGRTIFALPIPGDPKALSHPADYLTIGLAVVQIVFACFIFKFKWARIAIAYAAMVMLCLSIRAFALSIASPEGESLGYILNPFALALTALYGGVHVVQELFASFIVPFALVMTAIVTSFHDWRTARNSSGQGRTLQSELSE